MTSRLVSLCVLRRWRVLCGWIVLVVALEAVASVAGGASVTDLTKDARTESGRAIQLLEDAGARGAGVGGQLVVASEPGLFTTVMDPDVRLAVAWFERRARAIGRQVTVEDPYTQGAISADRRVAVATLDVGTGTDEVVNRRVARLRELAAQLGVPGVALDLGGSQFATLAPKGDGEIVGVVLALIILLVAFGSPLAALLPVLTAGFGIAVGLVAVTLVEHVLQVPGFATTLTVMLGLGVGVDYAMLIVTRFRSALTAGRGLPEALDEAMVTAGRSVAFAGCTVLICLLGLLAIGGTLGPALTIACAAGVLGVLLSTLTLLPALLALAGPRIERLSRRRSRRASAERAAWARRWSDVVQRHPWTAFGAGLIVVAVLAIPSLQMRLGVSDAGNLPTSDTTRKAFDAVERGFGPGANGPLVFVARTTSGPAGLLPLQLAAASVRRLPGVAGVTPPQAVGRVGDRPVVTFTATPATGPQDPRTGVLLDRARRLVARARPSIEVTGATAGGIDYGRVIERVLPTTIAGVLAAAFLLMCLALRSIVVPLKAVIANLLSIGAAYGVVVAVFQRGWGASLLGVGQPGPVDPWVPVLLFAAAVGLAMDYEVFLVTRIKEEFLRSGDPHAAVGEGLAATTRVIASAAAIMVCVFVAFVFVSERSVRMLGLGLAAAVLVDATVVRLLLVPATMQILGRRNWWWPAWLGGAKQTSRTGALAAVAASPAESGSVAR